MSERKQSVGSVRISARVRRSKPRGGHARSASRVFGLSQGQTETLFEGFDLDLPPGITAIVGPSGSGKSTLLDRLTSKVRKIHRLDTEQFARCDAPAIDAISDTASLPERLDALSRCGLAEASTMITPALRLSTGQLHRLGLARALLAWEPEDLLVVDEFAGPLDPPSAWVLSEMLSRLVERRGIRAASRRIGGICLRRSGRCR